MQHYPYARLKVPGMLKRAKTIHKEVLPHKQTGSFW